MGGLGPFNSNRAIPLQSPVPSRCNPPPNNFQRALRNGLRVAGTAVFSGGAVGCGLAALGSRPLGLSASALSPSRSDGQPSNNDSLLPQLTLTNGLILVNALLFGAQMLTKDALTVQGAKVNSLIVAGQWWRLITPAFLHGNLMHLAVNCYSLYNLAPLVETLSGGKRLLVVYLVAAVTGNVASFFGSAAPSLGASGAVFGVGGALGMYFYQNKELWGKRADYMLKSLWQTLLMNLVYGFANPRIDNFGHLGGLAGGALVAYLLGPKLKVKTVKGQKYLVDEPLVPVLAAKPREMRR